MSEDRFIQLVQENDGFEFYQAFRDDVDSHPHYHYMYGFGDKGLDVSEQYGVTIAFSDIKDTSTGFHLRYVYTGADVELP